MNARTTKLFFEGEKKKKTQNGVCNKNYIICKKQIKLFVVILSLWMNNTAHIVMGTEKKDG